LTKQNNKTKKTTATTTTTICVNRASCSMNTAEVQQLIANAVQQSQAHLTAQMEEQAAIIAQLHNQLLGNNGTQHDAEHNNGSGTELVQNQPMSFSGQETSTLRCVYQNRRSLLGNALMM
jgi:hypothetical protein